MYPIIVPHVPHVPYFGVHYTWTVSWDISTLGHRVAQKVARSIKVAQVAHFESHYRFYL